MKDNKTTLKKFIQTSDFSSGGVLNNAQAKEFIGFVMDESVVTQRARQKLMTAPIEEISRLHIGSRVLYAHTEGTAPSAGEYVTASGSQITLTSKHYVVPWEIAEDQMEDNVEEAGFETTLMKEVAAAVANDIEELALLGDTTGSGLTALDDGWIEKAKDDGYHTVTTVGLTDRTLNKSVFAKILKGLPSKYRGNRANLVFYVNPDDETDFRVSLAGRNTALGDSSLVLNENLKIFGIEVVPVPKMTQGDVVLTVKTNFIFGIWRRIKLRRDEDIYADTRQFAFHMRIAFAVEKGDAVVFCTDVQADT